MSRIPIMQCDAEYAKCHVNVTAFNGIPWADVIEMQVFSSSH
jgi:hypothetical protein